MESFVALNFHSYANSGQLWKPECRNAEWNVERK